MSAAKRQKVGRKSRLKVPSKLLTVAKSCPPDVVRYFESLAKAFLPTLWPSLEASYVVAVRYERWHARLSRLNMSLVRDLRDSNCSSFRHVLKQSPVFVDSKTGSLRVDFEDALDDFSLGPIDVRLANRETFLAHWNAQYVKVIVNKCKLAYQRLAYIGLLDRTVGVWGHQQGRIRLEQPLDPKKLYVTDLENQANLFPEASQVTKFWNFMTRRHESVRQPCILLRSYGSVEEIRVPADQNPKHTNSFFHLVGSLLVHLHEGPVITVLHYLKFYVDKRGTTHLN